MTKWTRHWEKADLHPFWFISRASPDEEPKKPDDSIPEPNMDAIYEDMTCVAASGLEALVYAKVEGLTPVTDTYSVSFPCLVNTVPIASGTEVILSWKAEKLEKKESNRKTVVSVFDQINILEKQKKRKQ